MNFILACIFYFFFYTWTIIFFIIFSPVNLFSQKFVLRLSKFWTGSVIMLSKKILRIKYELVGLENIPKDRFFLLASNHQSAWETFFLSFFFNKSAFILKKELRKVPLISRYFKKLGFIFIDRENGFQSIKKIINSINLVKEKGVKIIIIFPEGTRTPINKVGNINAGVFAIHKLLKIPVLVVKHNSGKYWRNKKFIKRPGKIKVEIFPIIEKIEKKEVFIETINKLFY